MPNDTYDYEFWLVFEKPAPGISHRPSAPRCVKGTPDVNANQRAMKVKATLPRAIFETPSLSATLKVSGDSPMTQADIDLDVATEALKMALGCDVILEIQEPSE